MKLLAIKLTLRGEKVVYGQQSARHLFVLHKIHVLVLYTKEWFYQNAHHSMNISKGVKVIKRELCPQIRRPYLFQLAFVELTPSVQFRPNLATSFDILKSLWLRMSYTLCFAPICSLKSTNRPGINNSLCLFVLSWILQCLYNSMIICINLNRDNCR